MEYNEILIEVEDRLRIITINKPKAMNSISPLTSAEMEAALDEFAANPEELVCIITGAGERSFCAGNDIKYLSLNFDKMEEQIGKLKCGFGGITSRTGLYKPVIAAVNGVALGGGFEIALAADFIIAAENAVFGLPEPRVGLMALAGGVHRLHRRIPYHRAMEILFTAKKVPANEAFDLGLVNEVVSSDKLLETAKKWAAEITKGAPLAIQATKEAIINGLNTTVEEAINTTYPIAEAMLKSEDMMEGSIAFMEKREPKWKGK